MKYYFESEKVYKVELSLRRRALRDCINFINFAFWIKCYFNVFGIVILFHDPCIFSIKC